MLMRKNVAGLNPIVQVTGYFSNQDKHELIISFTSRGHSFAFQISQMMNATYLLIHLLWRMRQ